LTRRGTSSRSPGIDRDEFEAVAKPSSSTPPPSPAEAAAALTELAAARIEIKQLKEAVVSQEGKLESKGREIQVERNMVAHARAKAAIDVAARERAEVQVQELTIRLAEAEARHSDRQLSL